MLINVHMKENKAAKRVVDLKPIGIRILDLPTDTMVLPTDTMVQSVEHWHDKPKVWVCILVSATFFICSIAFFLSMLPWRSVGMFNFDWGLHKCIILI